MKRKRKTRFRGSTTFLMKRPDILGNCLKKRPFVTCSLRGGATTPATDHVAKRGNPQKRDKRGGEKAMKQKRGREPFLLLWYFFR